MLNEVPVRAFSRVYYSMTILCVKFNFSYFVLYVYVCMFIVCCLWNKTSLQCCFTYFQLTTYKEFLVCFWNVSIQSLEVSFYLFVCGTTLLFIAIMQCLICPDV